MIEHLVEPTAAAIPIRPLSPITLPAWLARQEKRVAAWVEANRFTAASGKTCLVPNADGGIAEVLIGIADEDDLWPYGALPALLPEATYRLVEDGLDEGAQGRAALGWALGAYGFARYKAPERELARLAWPGQADRSGLARTVAATYLVRDLINTPSGDMGPAELAEAAERMGKPHGASIAITVGEALLAENYPAIHAVGRASARAPRLIDLRWGRSGPKITLVGKGVCFDSGGLDIKSSANMKLMKKDMGGAAHVLALAQMVMAAQLPVRLRMLIPAVENSIAGNAYRPLDVIHTRKGLTVEIGNTDAEGRVILCDALAEADREGPDLLIDCATLTGAARVALGPDLPALFSNHNAIAEALIGHGQAERDPVWRLPLFKPYRRGLDSKVADLNNIWDSPFAGAITAALFLQEFVSASTPWVHLDIMAWNTTSRPGRPEGGEAVGLRALYALVAERAMRG
ncbi:MAG TPA: leucyl aminopeptidase family protein [Alphaproteobacteria bacterium]|nr:leucyl aminopeptidase family protein [Alphaproteobacteria bacterium]